MTIDIDSGFTDLIKPHIYNAYEKFRSVQQSIVVNEGLWKYDVVVANLFINVQATPIGTSQYAFGINIDRDDTSAIVYHNAHGPFEACERVLGGLYETYA